MTSQIVGGVPSLTLNNFGEEYDRFYVHQVDLSSIRWMGKHASSEVTITVDQYSWLNFQSETARDQGYLHDMAPGVIPNFGYVYASYSNITTDITRVSADGKIIKFQYPKQFLADNKDLIYSSGKSLVFK